MGFEGYESETDLNEKPKEYKLRIPKGVLIIAFTFLVVMLVAASFWLGGYHTCKKAGGKMYGQIKDFDCRVTNVLDVCEYEGVQYNIKDIIGNQAFIIK